MSTIQEKLKGMLIDKLITYYKGSEETHESLKEFNHAVNQLDYEREIIVFITRIPENTKDTNYDNVYNIRIKKKDPSTGKFEFTAYKGRMKFRNA